MKKCYILKGLTEGTGKEQYKMSKKTKKTVVIDLNEVHNLQDSHQNQDGNSIYTFCFSQASQEVHLKKCYTLFILSGHYRRYSRNNQGRINCLGTEQLGMIIKCRFYRSCIE